jgi:hypothetical protein
MARSLANDSIRAAAMQRFRLDAEHPEDEDYFGDRLFRWEADFEFFLIALRRLRRAGALIYELTEDAAVATAIRRFDERIPDLKQMRDVREHLDAYLADRGRLQSKVPARSLGVRTWTGTDETGLTFSWAGMAINLPLAMHAANTLYAALRGSRISVPAVRPSRI